MRLDPWSSFPRELGVGGDSLFGNSPVESISPSLNLRVGHGGQHNMSWVNTYIHVYTAKCSMISSYRDADSCGS